MSFLDERVGSEEFATLTPFQKSEESKQLFGQTLEQSPELSKAFTESDQEGQQAMLGNFRSALVQKFPDQFTKKRSRMRTETTFEGEAEQTEVIQSQVETEEDVPILDPKTEQFVSLIESGDLTPDLFIKKDAKDFSDDDSDDLAQTISAINSLVESNQISAEQAQPFKDAGLQVLEATGKGKARALIRAGLGKGALRLGDISGKILDPIGETFTEAQEKLGIIDEKTPEEKRKFEQQKRFTSPLEEAVLGQELETAETVGAISTAIFGGVAAGRVIGGLSATSLQKLGLTAAAEAVIGVGVESSLPGITAELAGVEKGSISSQALTALEGAFLGTVGTLIPKASRTEIAQGFRELFSKFESPKLSKATTESISADAQAIAKRFNVPVEEAQKVADEIFSQEPIALKRGDAAEAERIRQSAAGAAALKEQLAEEAVDRFSKITPDEAAKGINTVTEIEEALSPVDIALNRSRVGPTGKPVEPEARRALRKSELVETFKDVDPTKVEPAKLAEEVALSAVKEKGEALQSLFDSTKVNNPAAKRINQIEETKTFARAEKDQLIIAARNGDEAYKKKLDEVLERRTPEKNEADIANEAVIAEQKILTDSVPAGTIAKSDINAAKASLRLADSVENVEKLTKAEINELLVDPVPVDQIKNTPKREILDRFELDKNKSLTRAADEIEPEPLSTKVDPEVKIEEASSLKTSKSEAEFDPSGQSKQAFNEDVDSAANPNRPNDVQADPPGSPDTAAKQEEITGNPATSPESHGSVAAAEAHDRIIKRISKQFAQEGDGKSPGTFFSPQMVTDMATVGADLISRGAKKFSSWAKAMVGRYGDTIKESLNDIWDASKHAFNNIKRKPVSTANAIDESAGLSVAADQKWSRKIAQNKYVRAFDNVTSNVSTQIGRISKSVKGRITLLEKDIDVKVNAETGEVSDFINGMSTLRKKDRKVFQEVNRAFMNTDMDRARDTLLKAEISGELKDQLAKGIDDTRVVLDRLRDEGNAAGLDVGFIDNYMPRTVKDHDGLIKSLNMERRSAIEKIWADEAARVKRSLNSGEKAELANRYIQRGATGGSGGKLTFEKSRKFDEVTEEMLPYYGDVHKNVVQYIGQMRNRIEMQNFFGRGAKVPIKKVERIETVTLPDGSKMQRAVDSPPQLVDYDRQSIGAFIEEANPNISLADKEELTDLLKARFVEGEMSSDAWVQNVRNVGYMATMGKFTNTVTQIADFFPTIRRRPGSFIAGVKGSVSEDGLRTVDFGITRILEEHASNPMITAKALDKLFTTTGLKNLDKFGKTVFLNAALDDFQKIAKGTKSARKLDKFTKKHNELFGEEFTTKLLDDLKKGVRSYEVDAAVFNDLTEIMPITKSQMPKAYLEHPNMRLFYMLKTFQLKLMDQIRVEGFDQLADATQLLVKGGPKDEVARLASDALMRIGLITLGGAGFEAGTSDMLKDWVRGKPINVDSFTDASVANLQRFAFMNKHTLRRFGKKGGGIIQQTTNNMLPPVISLGDQLVHDGMLFMEGDLSMNTAASTSMIPLAGDILWWRGEAGQKRVKEMKEEIAKGESPLYDDIAAVSKKSRKDAKSLKEAVDWDMLHLEELPNDRDRARYLQQLKAQDPLRWKKTFSKFRKERAVEQRGLTEVEVSFMKLPTDVRAEQLAKMINNMGSARQKKEFYAEMRKKRIISPAVKKLLDPRLKGRR